MIKEASLTTKLRVVLKAVWILLFVCAAVRTVYPELVDRTSADDFIFTYRQFVARYGTPRLIRSYDTKFVALLVPCLVWSSGYGIHPPPPTLQVHGMAVLRTACDAVKSPLRRVLGWA